MNKYEVSVEIGTVSMEKAKEVQQIIKNTLDKRQIWNIAKTPKLLKKNW